jgi:hypothetical protein
VCFVDLNRPYDRPLSYLLSHTKVCKQDFKKPENQRLREI